MDTIFDRKLSRPQEGRKYFFDLLTCLSVLYLDYLLITKDIGKLWSLTDGSSSDRSRKLSFEREARLRTRFLGRLITVPCLGSFKPNSMFSELTGLNALEDYTDAFSLHLPEIYEETLQLDESAKVFKRSFDPSALADIEGGLRHMARNHISFVHFALEGAADEASWS